MCNFELFIYHNKAIYDFAVELIPAYTNIVLVSVEYVVSH